MYQIKAIPEDFIVKEKSHVKPEKDGKYSYFILKKRNYTTVKAAECIAKKYRIPLKFIGFAGSKDRIAVTEQAISIKGNYSGMDNLDFKDIKLTFLGRGNEPISLGELEGNNFEIVVRNIDKKPDIKKKFINYFGEQRFGKNNKETGMMIVKGKFKDAAESIDDFSARQYLEKHPADFVGAIKCIPKKIQMMYVHAYQSYIWNKTAEVLRGREENISIPVVGFGTEYGDEEVKATIKNILLEEGIKESDFVIRQIPELSSEGSMRNLFEEIHELSIGELEDDELNEGRKKCRICFFLKKSSYATEAIQAIFSLQEN